ncbi:MAG: acetyl-CoA acetyltransferase [bacterium]|nr:acetyl-CoA acetyltransferase [bacterium]
MTLSPRTPVLVGIAAIEQRLEDPSGAREAWELMADALLAAGEDSGHPSLLREASSIRVPRGFWQYSDPGRLVADRLEAKQARTTVAEIGVPQQTLLSEACLAIAAGEEEVALVTGAEARFRELRARKLGVELADTLQTDVEPDRRLTSEEALFDELEVERGLMIPVRAFAVMESALRHSDRMDLVSHQDELARLWAGASQVAASNPHAWKRAPVSFEEIRTLSPKNRMLAFPYARLHNSDWNVDQAAGLILCSYEKAQGLGIPDERRVYPLAASESHHMIPLSARDELHRCPGAAVAGQRALELAGRRIDEIGHFDLYSCFPAPVRVFARELGLAPNVPFSVTGGMASAGGPLNNYVLQASVRMAEVLRDDPGSAGLVTTVSGFMNKVGFAIWSTAPPAESFRFADVSEEVAARSTRREIVGDHQGPARVLGYTVVYAGEHPSEGIAVCELPDGRRTIAVTRDAELAAAMTREEFCGRDVMVGQAGELRTG